MNARKRINELRAMMPPDMRARVDAKHAELNPTWRNWDHYGMAPVRVIHVADREAPPDIHRPSVERLRAIGRITQERGKVAPVNPDPIAEMTCGEREYGQAPCLHCKQPFTKTGPSHHACSTACRKQIRNAYQRAYMRTLSPEKREAARGRRKRTVTSFGGAESASASNGSSGVGSAAARTPKEGEYGKQN